ncbi:cytochrome C biogenesis protein CcdA [Pilimelia terevasa]|uniref:Cytochrome C biogenesis protein CcdA n=1 Tax=Pilimelia terevasa TaxID=53372 RepID=A0A8J3BQX9_9ACTN|nr:cytochrome c biogenesis protein CcdA [Pilimelia terevasa]GGK42679.1 cytochrome C biogenesis protein CcdA [Pilimelia terevasa]
MTDQVPLAVAVAAGMLAAVHPCGFALLPAYLSLLVVGDARAGRATGVGRALGATAAMTAGFVAVFGVSGTLLAGGTGALQRHLPWFTVALGAALAVAGLLLLAGREIPALVRGPRRTPRLGGYPGLVLFGAAYATASLGCAIAPFMAVVGATAAGGTGTRLPALLAFAAGIGLLVGAAALAVACARASPLGRLRRLAPHVGRAGGALLVVVGAYLAYVGRHDARLARGDVASDPLVTGAAEVALRLGATLDRVGPAAGVALFAVLLAAAWLAGRRRAVRARPPVS